MISRAFSSIGFIIYKKRLSIPANNILSLSGWPGRTYDDLATCEDLAT